MAGNPEGEAVLKEEAILDFVQLWANEKTARQKNIYVAHVSVPLPLCGLRCSIEVGFPEKREEGASPSRCPQGGKALDSRGEGAKTARCPPQGKALEVWGEGAEESRRSPRG